MALWLKQSTSVDVAIGPFLDETDGKTAETTLTITQPDIRLKKNNGNWAQKNAAQTLSHEEAGWYEVTLDATDTNTLGILVVAVHESGALPVWDKYLVVPANLYDSVISGTDLIDVSVTQLAGSAIDQTAGLINANVKQISTDATAADNAEAFFDGTGYAGTNNIIPTVSSVTAIATNGVTAAALHADAVNKIVAVVTGSATSNGNVGGTTIIDTSRTESVTDYWVGGTIEILSGACIGQIRRISDFNETTDTITVDRAFTAQIASGVTYRITRQNHTQPSSTSDTDDVFNAVTALTLTVGSPAGASVSADIANLDSDVAGVQSDTNDIQTRLPAALVSGRMDSSVGAMAAGVVTATAIAADAIGASELAADAATEIAAAVWDKATASHVTSGTFGQRLAAIRANTAQAGAATTITLDASASAVNDFYKNALLFITAGTGVGQGRFITAYDGATKVATVSTWATNPANDSVFVIIPFDAIPGASAPTAAQVADAVWDEARSGHTSAGSFGQGVASVTGNVAGNVTGSIGSLATQAKADVNLEVDTALADVHLDHLVGTAVGIPAITSGTYLDQIMDDGTESYNRTTDSLQAIRDAFDEEVAPAVVGSSLSGSGTLSDAVATIRQLTDEPSINEKYSSTDIVRYLRSSMATVTSEINANSDHPLLARLDVTIVVDKQTYHLPCHVQKVYYIAKINSATGRKDWEMLPGTYWDTEHKGFKLEGQSLRLLSKWKTGDTVQIAFVPDSEPYPHKADSSTYTSTTFTFPTTATDGTLDTRPNCYAGYVLRILSSDDDNAVYTQERIISEYDNQTRVATVAEAFSPELDGEITYEVVPNFMTELLLHVWCLHTAMTITAAEGLANKYALLDRDYQRKLRGLRMKLRKEFRIGGVFENQTPNNPGMLSMGYR